jgi:hypothetical protein
MPRPASVYPVECRSMWTCTENGSPAASPDASDTHTAEWLAALIDEHASPLDPVSLLLPLQQLETVHLIALEVMDAISAALEPARDDGPRSVASWARAICSPKQSTATKRRLWFSVWLKSKAISPERSLRENRRRYSPKPSQI